MKQAIFILIMLLTGCAHREYSYQECHHVERLPNGDLVCP